MMRMRFASYESYADATLRDIFTPEELNGAKTLSANYLQTSYCESRANGHFVEKSLQIEAQFAPVYAIAPVDFNKDGNMDVLMAGNMNQARLRFGRYDANYGLLLQGDGEGNFTYVPQNKSGLQVKGDVRSILPVNNLVLFGVNQQDIKAYKIK